jgi:glycosyltransferase involved in cell wall biosynthesis
MKVLHIESEAYPYKSGHTIRSENIFKAQLGLVDELAVIPTLYRVPEKSFLSESSYAHNGITYFRPDLFSMNRFYNWIAKTPKMRTIAPYLSISLSKNIIYRMIQSKNFSVINGHSNIYGAYPAFLIAKKVGIPFIFDIHNLSIFNYGYGPIQIFVNHIELKLLKESNAIIAMDFFLKDFIVEKIGIDREKIFVAPNGINSDSFANLKDQSLIRNLKIPADRFIVGVDNSKKSENFDFIYTNIDLIKKSHPQIFFVVFGSKSEKCPDENYFKVLPRVEYSDMPKYYSMLDLFMLPRVKNEQTDVITPLKILEIMSCEIPVMVSDAKGLTDCIENGVSGFIFKSNDLKSFHDTLNTALAHDSLKTIGKNARKWVIKNKSWDASAQEYLQAYQFSLNNHKSNIFST